MRSREEIVRDFVGNNPSTEKASRDEHSREVRQYEQSKLLLEVLVDVRDALLEATSKK